MANKKKSTAKQPAAKKDESVVRIKAGTSTPAKKETTKKADTVKTTVVAEKPAKAPKVRSKSRIRGLGIFGAIGGYFKGAWFELRQVRWPNRRATWSLTGAVLLYSAFFVILVLLLDALFKYMFDVILGK